MVKSIFAVITALALVAGASTAAAQEFYRGKTLRFVVGFPPKGGFDIYARSLANHIGKHIPGNPSAVVENMPGAGSQKAANYMFHEAKPDGLTIGNFGGFVILHQALMGPRAKLDGRKFGWLGVPVVDNLVCALTKQSGVTKVDQWFASNRPIRIGGMPGSSTEDTPKVLRATIGLPVEVVTKYQGTISILKAAEAGEVDGGCWAWESMKVMWRQGLEAGNVRVALQVMTKSAADLKDVPLAIQYAKSDDARELLQVFAGAYGYVNRAYSVPPGTPAERLAVLRKAFMETLKDSAFVAETRKAGLELNPIEGETVAKIFASLVDLRPELLAKLREIVLPKS